MKTIILSTLLMTIAAESPGSTQPIIVEDTALPSVAVRIADLNLSSDAGRETLDRRVRNAADVLCTEPTKADLDRLAETRGCYRAAMSSARLQVKTFDRASAVAAAAATIVVTAR